jgi:hypothetical protein
LSALGQLDGGGSDEPPQPAIERGNAAFFGTHRPERLGSRGRSMPPGNPSVPVQPAKQIAD